MIAGPRVFSQSKAKQDWRSQLLIYIDNMASTRPTFKALPLNHGFDFRAKLEAAMKAVLTQAVFSLDGKAKP